MSALLSQLRGEICELVDYVRTRTARVEVPGVAGSGSGSAWLYADELWVTNQHVVDGSAPRLFLHTSAGDVPARVLGADPHSDLAVLHAEKPFGQQPLAVRSEPASLGELCFAFGAPLGVYPDSVSMGLVSGLNRRLPSPGGITIEGALQTDAAINPGNSGGPLVDVDGQVLGVNVGVRSDGNDIGFAIASDLVREVAAELVEHGEVARASLGVSLEVAKEAHGVEVLTVVAVSTADNPLRPSDELLAIDGTPISHRQDLQRALNRAAIGRELQVAIRREGEELSLPLTAARREDQPGAARH
ncbi:MAG: trypsin-like peptidase domain-containing protein [Acidimicrobiales bacterium]|nr:trypsin-like peptidase domain-containing protein [Acidimicrobiales bacterium]